MTDELFTDAELAAVEVGAKFTFDVECYPNFFMVAFRHCDSGRIVIVEASATAALPIKKLYWLMYRFQLYSYNGNGYDLLMIAGALSGASPPTLYEMSKSIIVGNLRKWDFEKKWGVFIPDNLNHVDLQEVTPLRASLKMRGAQMHSATIWDLPFDPNEPLTREQAEEVKRYCGTDLVHTDMLRRELAEPLELRGHMGQVYGLDLRSKSDAQIAEAVIAQKLAKTSGRAPKKSGVSVASVRYTLPACLQFDSPQLQRLLAQVYETNFMLDPSGYIQKPSWLDQEVSVGSGVYRLGIGGIHSSEEQLAVKATDTISIVDRDVASYYPAIILQQKLFPSHLGEEFLEVYASILADRLAAKARGDKATANSLKIVVNGAFGKLGSKWSLFYSPKLLLQVTLSGQLFLLMLIERLEAAGIEVISANTDGVVMKCPQSREDDLQRVVAWWEGVTGFTTEESRYRAYYARDVNSYVAVKTNGKVKAKGAYLNPWAGEEWADYSPRSIFRFHKNPDAIVCVEALWKFLVDRTPIADTVSRAQETHRFAIVEKVTGGASKDGERLGRVARWYWSTACPGPITAPDGRTVSNSDGGRPMQRMPGELPADLDVARYIARAEAMLWEVGHTFKRTLMTG